MVDLRLPEFAAADQPGDLLCCCFRTVRQKPERSFDGFRSLGEQLPNRASQFRIGSNGPRAFSFYQSPGANDFKAYGGAAKQVELGRLQRALVDSYHRQRQFPIVFRNGQATAQR